MSASDVDAWLAETSNPKKDVIAAVRSVIMTDDRIEEAIKYRAPAFLHGGIMAYFHQREGLRQPHLPEGLTDSRCVRASGR